MPHKLIWEPKGVYWEYSGKISGKEVIKSSTAIYGDPRFDQLRYKLVNFLDIETLKMDNNEVAQIACQHNAAGISNPNIKNAILCNSNISELVNQFTAFFESSPWEVQVFQDIDKASDWLGRTPSL